jgi:hypothetical protein
MTKNFFIVSFLIVNLNVICSQEISSDATTTTIEFTYPAYTSGSNLNDYSSNWAITSHSFTSQAIFNNSNVDRLVIKKQYLRHQFNQAFQASSGQIITLKIIFKLTL